MTQIFSIVAGLISCLATGLYFKQVYTGESVPNPASWLVWLAFSIVNTATYFLLVNKNIWLTALPIVLTAGVLGMFAFSLVKAKFAKFGKTEIISLLLVGVISIYWQISNNPLISNVALQIIFLISFYPTISGLLQNKLREKPLPWFLAAAYSALQVMIIMLNREIVGWAGLAFPGINLVGNGIIAVISLKSVLYGPHTTFKSNHR